MSINMADVKQIMRGTKEVAKIEDGLGNILWQKQTSKAYRELEYVYFSGTEYLSVPYSLIPEVNGVLGRSYVYLKVSLDSYVSRGMLIGAYDGRTNSKCRAQIGDYYTGGKFAISIRSDTRNTNLTYSNCIPLNTQEEVFVRVPINLSPYNKGYFVQAGNQSSSSTSVVPQSYNLDTGIMSCHSVESNGTDHYTNMANGKVYILQWNIGDDAMSTTTTRVCLAVPAQRKSDGVCGLYNKDNNTFYPMQGTNITTSAAGPTVNENPDWSN